MKRNLVRITLFFAFLLVICGMILYWTGRMRQTRDDKGTELVLLNEIEILSVDQEGNSLAPEAINELKERISCGTAGEKDSFTGRLVLFFCLFGLVYLTTVLLYVYRKILRPFDRLQQYAERIAGGDLEVSLGYERKNFFGAFTWAFDRMREEILYTKKKEQIAIEENKTVIAALSHDIKTPIASIRAYSEGLEANLNSDYEKREHYVSIIMKKCDEVTALVNDLVLHSLSELEKLEIHLVELDLQAVIRETVQELGFPQMKLIEPIPSGIVLGDAKRIAQILENLLNNARKYAKDKEVHVYTERSEGRYMVHVRDFGKGILPEDMPFILNKFYRGKNASNQPGSGLGLYIVKYLIEAMHGEIKLVNSENGLDAIFWLPLQKKYFS